MQQELPSNRPFYYFGAYCFGGVSLLSYFTFRGLTKAANKIIVDRPVGSRLQLSKMGSLGGVWKAGLAMGVYLCGFVYLTYKLNLGDAVFRSCIRKDQNYVDKIKLDPLFQDFYVINVMQYFGIKDELIRKTEKELRDKIEANGGAQIKKGVALSLERAVINVS